MPFRLPPLTFVIARNNHDDIDALSAQRAGHAGGGYAAIPLAVIITLNALPIRQRW